MAPVVEMFRPDQSSNLILLNHTVPETSIMPASSTNEMRIAYVGIGWDKISGGRGRHSDLLKALDPLGVLSIYGPKVLSNGVKPWKGFKSYAGPLEFDGISVLNALNKSGLSLCLSSDSHIGSEIQSNRIFETIAAGCLPIVEMGSTGPFSLAECVFLDMSQDSSQLVESLRETIKHFKANPADYLSRVSALQTRMRDGFTLEKQLSDLIDSVKSFRVAKERATSAPLSVYSIPEAIRKFLGIESKSELTSGNFSCLSTQAFRSFVIKDLKSKDSVWVGFEHLDTYAELGLKSPEQSGFDVIWLNGFARTKGEGPVRAINQLKDKGAIQRMLLRRELFVELLQEHPLLSVSLIAALVYSDSESQDKILKHHVDWFNTTEFDLSVIIDFWQTVGQWDEALIAHGELSSQTSPSTGQRLVDRARTTLRPSPSGGQRDLLDLPSFVRAASAMESFQFRNLVWAGLRKFFSIK